MSPAERPDQMDRLQLDEYVKQGFQLESPDWIEMGPGTLLLT